MTQPVREMVKALLRGLFTVLSVDALFRCSQRIARQAARLVHFRDWELVARGRPQFYNHQLNLYQWRFDPRQWAFTARGVYPRERMFPGCTVLDLCCGDGSYSYLFFSDIAGSVDAVDNDRMAIEYARKTYLADNLRFYRLDAVRDPFPASGYDVIVLNAAISYFSEAEIGVILEKIVRALVPNGFCYGMTPVANDYIDHKTEFEGGAALERVLRHFFSTVDIKLVDEVGAKNLYFCATGPVSTAKG